ncbi:MAG: hypothetical protein ACRETK_14355, partial [Steroidobacteraceae bacterium]
MNADLSGVLAAVWPHVHDHMHDIGVSALAAAVATLGVVILLELRSVLKLRQVVDGNLARVFEQLDLLRFESQQLIEGQQLLEACAQSGTVSVRRQVASGQPAAAAAGAAATVPAATVKTTVLPNPSSPAAAGRPGNVYQNAAVMAATGVPAREIV